MLALSPVSPGLYAHGNVSEKILKLNEKIAKEPDRAEWRFKRGVNWLLNQHADDALADFLETKRLAPDYPDLGLYLGRSYLALGDAKRAIEQFNQALQSGHSSQAEIYPLRAEAYVQLGDYTKAAQDMAAAIRTGESIQPDWYVKQARWQQITGSTDAALLTLQQASAQLGALLLFEQTALDIEVAAGRKEPALKRIARLLEQPGRRDIWLEQRGDIQQQFGDAAAAQQSFAEAKQAFLALPALTRSTPAAQAQLQRLQQKTTALTGA